MVEYRELPEDRMDEFRSFVTYAFMPEEGPFDPDEADEIPVPAQIGDSRGLFEGTDLLSVCRHFWFEASVRDATVPMAGLSVVATPPEYRRRGLVRELLQASIAEYRDRDVPIAALWPFKHPFYRRFGWATCNDYARHRLAPSGLAFAREHAAGRVRRLDPDDWPAMADVLAAHGVPYELTVERSEEWWRKRVFHGWGTDPYVYGWTDDGGDLRGYVVYTIDEGDDGRQLQTWDVAHADHEARVNLLRFLADHDSQVETVELYGPAETSLFHLVEDPDAVTTRVRPGPMLRLVDVPAALEAVRYPPDADVSATLAVSDPLAPWNERTVELDVADGAATCDPVDPDADPGADPDPDARVEVGSLSQLFVGHRSAPGLAETGDLAADAGTVAALDAAFPESRAFLREVF